MNNVRWLGPYEPEGRHADTVTIDHIIKLQKRMSEVEGQMNNALNMCVSLVAADRKMRDALAKIALAEDWPVEKLRAIAEQALK